MARPKKANASAGDYNDVVVRIKALPPGVMPEASTVALTVFAMVSLGLIRRHKHCA
jgi:hypothetical protein